MNRRRLAFPISLCLGFSALVVALAPAPQAPGDGGKLKTLAEARASVARKIADFYVDRRLAPPDRKLDQEAVQGSEQVEIWTRRYVDARLEAASGAEERIAILTEDFDRTKAIEARIKALADQERGPAKIDTFKSEYYRLDAEYRLAKEKATP